MLLAQPFDPFANQQPQRSRRRLPFLMRCRLISQRTRQAIASLRNRAYYASRELQPVMMLDNHFMPTPPPPQPWYYCPYEACYNTHLPPNAMMASPSFPNFPPLGYPLISHQQTPYSICVHLSPCNHTVNEVDTLNNRGCYSCPYDSNSSINDSTLYSSAESSLYDGYIDHYSNDLTSDQRRKKSDIVYDRSKPYMQRRWSSSHTI